MGTVLRERDGASEAVAALLDSARAGRGGVLFVEGDAGLGKSTILESARECARPDLRVGLGQGDSMEMSLPFGVLDQALSMLGGPTLLTDSAAPIGRPEQLYRLLRWLERGTPGVLLALDDLHWADSDSLELLSLLCRRIGVLPVAVIATMRCWPADAIDVASSLVGSGLAHQVRLAPLSREGSMAMLIERTGRPVSDAAARKAWELSAGNPLLLQQVASAINRGAIDASAEESWPTLQTDTLLLSRFAGLPLAALRFVRAACVLGVRFHPDVAAEVAGLTQTEADRAIETLGRTTLIDHVTPEGVRFVHPLFAQALYDDLPGAVRARLHAHSFEVLSRRGLDAEAAEHALRAGLRDAEVVAALERAGRAALGVGALGTAAAQLGAAVELAGDRANSSLLMAQGAALLGSGNPIAASVAYERVLSRPGSDQAVRATALRMRGRALYAGGDHVPAAACFADAVELALADDPLTAAETLIDQAMSMHIVLGPKGSLPLATRALELVAGADDRLRLRAEAAHGYLTVMAGDPAGLDAAVAAARAAQANPRPELTDPAWSWGLASIHAHTAKYLEHFDVARRGFRSSRIAAEQLGAAEALTMSLIGEAEVAARTGHLTEALELSDRAGELTDVVPLGATHNAVVRFFVLLHLDRAEEADACRRQLDALLDERDEGIARIWLLHLQGITHLGLGRPEAAATVYLRAEQISDQLGIGEPCVVPWAGRAAIAHARAGRDTDAARVLHRLDACAQRLPCRYPAVAAEFGRAELAIRHASHRAAEHHYREALALHDGAELPMERASTLLAYGDMLRRNGEPSRARPVFAEALHTAEAVGAPALARYAREGLSSSGGRRRRVSPDGRLTPQELRIARLVKAGNSRREIAQRLTVSEATVRTHLQHIYTKLDIHSARELMIAKTDQLAGNDRE
jgi:DNA-binding CsgD family transcriptional regulator/tetratricopeptide (TPR) repeat protein